jgi:hypothetical protein
MNDKALPMIDDDLYDLEMKVKKAKNRKKFEKKRQFHDSIEKNRLSLDKL